MLPRQVLTLRLFSSNPPPHARRRCFVPRQKLTCTYGRTQHVFFRLWSSASTQPHRFIPRKLQCWGWRWRSRGARRSANQFFKLTFLRNNNKKKKSCSEDKANKAGGCNHLETNKKRKRKEKGLVSRLREQQHWGDAAELDLTFGAIRKEKETSQRSLLLPSK